MQKKLFLNSNRNDNRSIGERFILLSLFSMLSFSSLFAQVKVLGTIIDISKEPLIGVTVKVRGGTTGTISGANGKFSITVPTEKSILEFSYIGFLPQSMAVGKGVLNVVLQESIAELEELVVVGYGAMRKRDVTGAIASINAEAIQEKMPVTVFDALQGQTAGVQIITGSGAPGEGADIRIRGVSTFDEGAKPLFVVDGVPMDNIDNINPADIENLEVLKDAASAAIYGSRSANGVILVTTKQGERAKPKIEIRYLKSFSELTRQMPRANVAERRYYDKLRTEQNGSSSVFTLADTLAFVGNSGIDLESYLFRVATRDQIDFSVSGASETFKYYMSAAYLSDKGVIVNSNYDRFTSRINSEYKASKSVVLGSKLQFSYATKNGIDENDGALRSMIERPAYIAVFNPDGTYVPNLDGRTNPLAVAMTDVRKTQSYRASLYEYLNWQLTKKLKLNVSLQGNFSMDRYQQNRNKDQWSSSATTYAIDRTLLNYDLANENYLTWNDKINNHEYTVMVGNSTQYWGYERVEMRGLGMTTDQIYTLNAASSFDPTNTYTRMSASSMLSFFGRSTYSYKGKYLANINMRYDGSSRFGKNNRWGAFPSASLGWRFSDEKFMRFTKSFMSDGKIRLSAGVTGNQRIGDYDSWQLYTPNYLYEGVAGIAPSNISDPNLGWEETAQYNAGLDLRLIKNKLRISFDYYKKLTDKLLARVELPKETGFSSTRRNVGSMTNEGYELTVDWDVLRTKKWRWNINANASTNNTMITRVADGIPFYRGTQDAIYVQAGARLGEFYGYKYLGVFAYNESNAFTPTGERLTPVFSNGIFQNKYYHGTELYTGVVKQKLAANGDILKGGDVDMVDTDNNWALDLKDKTLIGCAQPYLYGGVNTNLSYKAFSLSLSFYYSLGGEIYNYALARQNSGENDGPTPSPDMINNMWTKPGDDVRYPRALKSEHNRLAPSDFYIEDASYVKLKSARFTYTLPAKLVSKIGMKAASAYVYGNNLLTFSNYSGYDPEFSRGGSDALTLGIDQLSYPRKREYGLGINVTF